MVVPHRKIIFAAIPVKHRHMPVDLPGWIGLVRPIAASIVVISCLLTGAGESLWVIAVLAAVFVTPPLGLWVLRLRLLASPADASVDQMEDDGGSCSSESARLVCYGLTIELGELRPLRRDFFEVHVATPAVDYLPRGWRHLAPAVMVVAIVLGAPVFWAALVGMGCWWTVWCAARIRQTYLRVVPGRLDILRTFFLRATVQSLRSVCLLDARVVCRYDKQQLLIEPAGEGDAAEVAVDLASLAAPHALVSAVFAGAVSAKSAPDLPHDALLG